MSLPSSLVAPARSAYRAVLRAGRITFAGDLPRQQLWHNTLRQTFASPTLTPPPSASNPSPQPVNSEEEIAKRIQEWKEVALFLRRNVVQGVMDDKGETFKLRVTDDTELGDNATIKEPPKLPTTPFPNRNRQRRRKCGDTEQ